MQCMHFHQRKLSRYFLWCSHLHLIFLSVFSQKHNPGVYGLMPKWQSLCEQFSFNLCHCLHKIETYLDAHQYVDRSFSVLYVIPLTFSLVEYLLLFCFNRMQHLRALNLYIYCSVILWHWVQFSLLHIQWNECNVTLFGCGSLELHDPHWHLILILLLIYATHSFHSTFFITQGFLSNKMNWRDLTK